MKKLVVLTGAGISAESGLKTFRDSDGLWEGHNIQDVATPEGFRKNPELVLEFYNQRRRQLHEVAPNAGHLLLADLEKDFDVHIVTQNVDNLHERAGSSKVLHLHGELFKVRSTKNYDHVLDWETDLHIGDIDGFGHQLRPHIVWFGEAVPALDQAVSLTEQADCFAVVGTSLQVYPAAGLISYTLPHIPVFYVDPKPAPIYSVPNPVEIIAEPASTGVAKLREKLLQMR
ncbi:SIR2 family NAD-dependent protein deacylase [Flavobacterium caeni]|uniref:NAD-dependent protein deacylase n=1 Tax=Flavobacterium caeni TaxID=490189 RepID=A0A1G5IZ97_9FLAO|nr:NAD-dependent deacylase [Flavobacterium caeni]SCY81051.1 NAD-dependent deacetylase [Flavobacterium caeni]